MVAWPCPHRNFKMLADDSQLDPQRYKKGQEYEIEGELTGTNCVIVKKDSKGERSAISAARFEVTFITPDTRHVTLMYFTFERYYELSKEA